MKTRKEIKDLLDKQLEEATGENPESKKLLDRKLEAATSNIDGKDWDGHQCLWCHDMGARDGCPNCGS